MLLSTAFALCSLLNAQEDLSQKASENSERRTTHYVGLQVNEVLKQLFNLSNNQEVAENPYFINYQFNSNSTGKGMNFGLGGRVEQTETGDALSKTSTNINEASVRVGVEQKKQLGKKWLASIGLDALYFNSSNVTKSFTSNGIGNAVSVETDNRTESYGGGPRATIHFKLSPHVLLGTDASFYFTMNKHEDKTYQSVTSGPTTVLENSPTTKSLVFLGPRTLLLTIAF